MNATKTYVECRHRKWAAVIRLAVVSVCLGYSTEPPVALAAQLPLSKAQMEAEAVFKKHLLRGGAFDKLGELGTPEAKALLLDIALGRRGLTRIDQENASLAYRLMLKDRREARVLLCATNPLVVHSGLLHLRREPIDRDLLEDLQRLLQSRSSHVRLGCASVIREAPANEYPLETVRAMMASMETIYSVEDATDFQRYAGEPISTSTVAGDLFLRFIKCMAFTPTIPSDILRQLTPRDRSPVRDSLIVARASGGESGLREELMHIARTSEEDGIRFAALEVFHFRGTSEDIPFLQEVARTDPFVVTLTDRERQWMEERLREWIDSNSGRELPPGVPREFPRDFYPLRWYAEFTAIRAIRARERADKQGLQLPEGSATSRNSESK